VKKSTIHTLVAFGLGAVAVIAWQAWAARSAMPGNGKS
jgi:hypothetical protein